jgi:hypothetical protein
MFEVAKKFGKGFANMAVVVMLVALVALAANALWTKPDDGNCKPPPGVHAALAAEVKVQQAPRLARAQLQRVRVLFKRHPSARTRRHVRSARSELRRSVTRRKRWNTAVTAVIPEGAKTSFKLGNDVNTGPRSIKFTLNGPVSGPAYLQVTSHPFASATTGTELKATDLRAWARLDQDRLTGTMSFCVTPTARTSRLTAGEFSGDLVLTGYRVHSLVVPVTFSASCPNAVMVALVGVGVCFFSSVYVYGLRRPQMSNLILYGDKWPRDRTPTASDRERSSRLLRASFGFWFGYARFLSGASGAVTVVAGLLGAITAFKLQYLSSDAWSATVGEWLTYCGAVATAFIAAGTAGRLAQNKYEDDFSGNVPRDGAEQDGAQK